MNSNEFSNIKKGLPNEQGGANKFIIFIFLLFSIFLGFSIILIKIGVMLLNNSQSESAFLDRQIVMAIDNFISWPIYTTLLVFAVGMFRVFVIQDRITSNKPLSIITYVVGGVAGGFVSGLIINIMGFVWGYDLSGLHSFLLTGLDLNTVKVLMFLSRLTIGFTIGFVSGLVIGSLLGLIQYRTSKRLNIGSRWLAYNVISWSIILGIGWSLIFGLDAIPFLSFFSDVVGLMFVIITHYLSLLVFMQFSPQIEPS